MTHRQSPRRAGRIDVAAPETFPRRRSHAYFPCDKGDARLRRGDARHLPQPRACVRPDGRRAGRGAFCPTSLLAWAIRRALRRAGSTRVSVLTASASIASPPSGLITSDSTASAPTGSIASAPATLAATSFSSAAGAVGVGAAFPLRLGLTAPSHRRATARRSSSMSGPIPLQAPSPRDTEEACVIHKLIYDSSGKYAGERQSPQC